MKPVAFVQIPIGTSLDDAVRAIVLETLNYYDGNKAMTARALQCSLKTIYNKLNEIKSAA